MNTATVTHTRHIHLLNFIKAVLGVLGQSLIIFWLTASLLAVPYTAYIMYTAATNPAIEACFAR